jgi:hypothetical protein
MVVLVLPVPETDAEAGAQPAERRQRLVYGGLLAVLLLASAVGVTSLRSWQFGPGTAHRLQSDFDEFHLEDRFHRVSEDAGEAEPRLPGGEVRLIRTYRTAAAPQEAVAQVRSALRSAGVSSTTWTGPEGLQLTTTADLQDRGRQVSAAVTVDHRVPAEPTVIRIVLSDWA